jgi:2-polyprenyl-3-methyl-5-hydroxy-6-metoxy-1,4-benzoquinol methylase
MIAVFCPGCGASDADRPLWKIPDQLWFSDRRFQLVACTRCGSVYLNPRPDDEELREYYPGAPYRVVSLPAALPEAYRWRFSQIEQRKVSGKLLDVGCGEGFFLTFAVQRGWDAYGLDTSPEAIEAARKWLGDRVSCRTLREAGYPSETFDAVTLFEVIEHVADPIAHLREAHRILKPGGWIFLSAPNFASVERRLFGRCWVGLDAPRHLQQFTPRTLRTALRAADLEVHELRSVNADRIQKSKRRITYCQESMRYCLRAMGLYPGKTAPTDNPVVTAEESQPRPPWKAAVHALEWTLFVPVCALAGWLDRENSLWAVGRKA